MYRNPESGLLDIVMNDEEIVEFDTKAEAKECAMGICRAWGYEIVEVQI
jgi:hypothetical protein